MKSYKDLEVYKVSFILAKAVHELTMKLPKHELYELGSQVRRSAQSTRTNIVEGYGRRRYRLDFVKFLIYSHASLLETISHLEMLNELYEKPEIHVLIIKYEKLGSQIHNFIIFVETNWQTKPS
jgi:four helix bundle protein